MVYLDEAKVKFAEVFQGTNCEAKPSTEAEIREMEKDLNLSFPAAYKEFLLWMGNGTRGFIGHFAYRTHSLPLNLEDAKALVEKDALVTLPDDSIIFCWGSQGDCFKFIQAFESENPRVHEYSEGDGIFWETHADLQSFLLECINGYERQPWLLDGLREGF
ncbi:SMI1/KNR4 family protein [Leptolyngbya sp. GGD]|uniref:SMI1/KNR4 family protein n=1 Tax=Leptolyngbya sp. GGD TaxID=2997907 RepID=UPI00227CCE05|nr:SMI1/KNR4 family protein [Leptolyngbya sp. GGD]MCY6490248.1 SMI1/KNR4 family protein [Leptolyngbya sp. GGD]